MSAQLARHVEWTSRLPADEAARRLDDALRALGAVPRGSDMRESREYVLGSHFRYWLFGVWSRGSALRLPLTAQVSARQRDGSSGISVDLRSADRPATGRFEFAERLYEERFSDILSALASALGESPPPRPRVPTPRKGRAAGTLAIGGVAIGLLMGTAVSVWVIADHAGGAAWLPLALLIGTGVAIACAVAGALAAGATSLLWRWVGVSDTARRSSLLGLTALLASIPTSFLAAFWVSSEYVGIVIPMTILLVGAGVVSGVTSRAE